MKSRTYSDDECAVDTADGASDEENRDESDESDFIDDFPVPTVAAAVPPQTANLSDLEMELRITDYLLTWNYLLTRNYWAALDSWAEEVGFTVYFHRVPHVRLRREEEDAIQRGVSAPRELPEARSVEIFPRPVRITPARFRRPMTAAEAFGHLRGDVSHLADEGIDL